MAREFLAAKVPAFERTMVSLTPGELVYLYRHRQKIRPTEREMPFLPASILHNIEAKARNESPGAYWFSESSPQQFLRWFVQIEHWAAKGNSSFRPFRGWVETFPSIGLESEFATLAVNPSPFIRVVCAQWIGRTKREEDLPLLRELAKDKDRNVLTVYVQRRSRRWQGLQSLRTCRDFANYLRTRRGTCVPKRGGLWQTSQGPRT